MDVPCPHCCTLHWREEKLVDSSMANLRFSTCCNSGNVAIPLLLDLPALLQHFYNSRDIRLHKFKKNIWKYNCAFAFTSISVIEDHSYNKIHYGLPVFRIQGELVYCTGSLLPLAGKNPIYSQLYIYKLPLHLLLTVLSIMACADMELHKTEQI